MKHRSAALAAEPSESPQIPLFQDFCLDPSLSIEQIILGIRSSEVFTVLLAFFPLSSVVTIFTLILRRVPIFSLKNREYFSRPNV